MGHALLKQTDYTYADYQTWPDDVRYELLDGEAYMMTGPTRMHQELVGGIFRQVADALEGTPCRPYVAPFDVRLPRANEADDRIDTVVQPDISVICDRSKLDDKGCRGAPDWVIEVLSPATSSHDHIRKRRIYERHGVREYWLVHPTDKVALVYLLENGVYGKPGAYELLGVQPCVILPEVTIDWDRILNDIP
ncbi:MAG: Uma2 family endonuclease [Betaproteobacteria bacterium]|nr:Uma2 family endonuclease [Betaproteobacteria bacterium]